MSYAIIRNEKLTRDKSKGRYIHNERRTRGHTNKDIDINKTSLNYYLKKNDLSYIKEFDKLQKDNNLQGNIRSNSIIICEMIITSDNEFFNKIGLEETKRYFEESYKFVCNYKNLGEQNIISAVVHLDETTPHMHLVYTPVIHSKDKEGNLIDKICARDFWRGRDSYRKLQNDFHEYVTSKGFDLERGLLVEETGAKNERIEDLKKITNFENTKKVLNNIKLELPEVPNINDFKLIQLNKTKIENEIIKPKDELIEKLHEENCALYRELYMQCRLVDKAEKFEKERQSILVNNKEIKQKLEMQENEYSLKLRQEIRKVENKYEDEIYDLKKENKHLNKIVATFTKTINKFIHWICKKFAISEEDNLIRDFEKETNNYIDAEKQIKYEYEKKWDLELF